MIANKNNKNIPSANILEQFKSNNYSASLSAGDLVFGNNNYGLPLSLSQSKGGDHRISLAQLSQVVAKKKLKTEMKNQIGEQICFLLFLFGAKIISAQNDFEPDVEDSSFGNFFSTYVNFFLDTLNF